MAPSLTLKMAYRKYINPGLTKAIRVLYLHEETADVHFVFRRDGQRIPAHKNILFAMSQVFAVMLNGCWKEKDEIHIVDASSAAFGEFLQFFYLDEVELSMENIAEVINLAQKYNVVECLNACVRFLEYNMTSDNVCFAYQLAILFESDELKTLCNMNVQINPIDVFKSASFLSCDRKVLSNILKMDAILCTEVDLFNACMEWVKVASKESTLTREIVQNYLSNSFYDIQFGAMTMNEFSSIISTYKDFFSAAEYKDVIQMIKWKKQTSKYFNRISRRSNWDTNYLHTCKRSRSETSELMHAIGEDMSTTFYSTGNLLLQGIICAEIFRFVEFPLTLEQDLFGKLTIIETRGRLRGEEVSLVLCIAEVHLEAGKRTVIRLTKPVIVRRGIKYKLQLELNLPFPCCSIVLFKTTEMEVQDGVYIKFQNDTIKNGEKRGVIYGFQFITHL